MVQSIPIASEVVGGSNLPILGTGYHRPPIKLLKKLRSFFYFYPMLFHVYLLFSESKNRYYIGHSSDLEARLIRHNQKSKGFTGNTNDWKVVYTEHYNSKEEAQKRELQIKSWKSRIKIQELISTK